MAGAIRRKGGDVIDEEGQRRGPIRLGDAVVTTAGALPNRYVIHAAAMGYRAEDRRCRRNRGRGRAGDHSPRDAGKPGARRGADAESIVFPALATGVAAGPVDECAEVMIGAARAYAAVHPATTLARVVFVLFSEEDFRIFESVRDRLEREP